MNQTLSRVVRAIKSFWKKHRLFFKHILNELLGGCIYRMEDRAFGRACDLIKESIILNKEKSNIYVCVMHGEKEGYNACCIDFFTRCIILGEIPTDHGGMFSPDVEGCVLCPMCAHADHPELYFMQQVGNHDLRYDEWIDSCFRGDAFESSPILAFLAVDEIYKRAKAGESIRSIRCDFPFMTDDDVRYAIYFHEKEEEKEEEA